MIINFILLFNGSAFKSWTLQFSVEKILLHVDGCIIGAGRALLILTLASALITVIALRYFDIKP